MDEDSSSVVVLGSVLLNFLTAASDVGWLNRLDLLLLKPQSSLATHAPSASRMLWHRIIGLGVVLLARVAGATGGYSGP